MQTTEPGRERQLCAGILHQALADWWNVAAGTPTVINQELAGDLGYSSARAELVAFFESDWLDELCAACDLSIERYLEAVARNGMGAD